MNPVIAELAAAKGISPYALKKWRQRGHVPGKHWHTLLDAAAEAQKQLSLNDFRFPGTLKPKPQRRRAKKASQQGEAA